MSYKSRGSINKINSKERGNSIKLENMDEEAFIKEKLASKLTLRASDKSNELLSLPSMKKKGTLAFNDKDDDLLGGADRASMLFKN